MLLGPFVNNAVAALGNAGSGKLSELGKYCMSMEQEIEVDRVSARWYHKDQVMADHDGLDRQLGCRRHGILGDGLNG